MKLDTNNYQLILLGCGKSGRWFAEFEPATNRLSYTPEYTSDLNGVPLNCPYLLEYTLDLTDHVETQA